MVVTRIGGAGRVWRRAAAAFLIFCAAFESRPAFAGGGSYRKIDSEGDVALWYRTRGDAFVGKSVHLHVPRTVFRKPIEGEKRRTASRNLEFADRGVPVLVSPSNPYYQQFMRKRSSGGAVCVKGRVERRKAPDGKPVAVFMVETVGAAGDSHVKPKRGAKRGKSRG